MPCTLTPLGLSSVRIACVAENSAAFEALYPPIIATLVNPNNEMTLATAPLCFSSTGQSVHHAERAEVIDLHIVFELFGRAGDNPCNGSHTGIVDEHVGIRSLLCGLGDPCVVGDVQRHRHDTRVAKFPQAAHFARRRVNLFHRLLQ
jgi:hypothetical protein